MIRKSWVGIQSGFKDFSPTLFDACYAGYSMYANCRYYQHVHAKMLLTYKELTEIKQLITLLTRRIINVFSALIFLEQYYFHDLLTSLN